MKQQVVTRDIRFALVFIPLIATRAQAQNILLLDSLHGTWTMKEQYNNKARIEPKGSIEFLEDGTFKSNGSYFGSSEGLYRTDETRSTIHIEINGATSEWTASIRNHILRMTRTDKKKSPRVDLVLSSDKSENNSGF
jgi:hypothetical protein